MNFSDRLNILLKENNITAKFLTQQIGISQTSVSDWKRGKSSPSINTLIDISKLFNVSIDWLLTGETSTQQNESLQNPEAAILFKIYNSLDEKKQHIVLQKVLELANEE